MAVSGAPGAVGGVAVYRRDDSRGDVVLGGSHAVRAGYFPFDISDRGAGAMRAGVGAPKTLAPWRLCHLRCGIFLLDLPGHRCVERHGTTDGKAGKYLAVRAASD